MAAWSARSQAAVLVTAAQAAAQSMPVSETAPAMYVRPGPMTRETWTRRPDVPPLASTLVAPTVSRAPAAQAQLTAAARSRHAAHWV